MDESASQSNCNVATPVSAPPSTLERDVDKLSLPNIGRTLNRTQSAPLVNPIHTNFGTINGATLISPASHHNDIQYMMMGNMMVSPMGNAVFPFSPMTRNFGFGQQMAQMNHMNHMFQTQTKLPVIQPVTLSSSHQSNIQQQDIDAMQQQFQPMTVQPVQQSIPCIPEFNVCIPPTLKTEDESVPEKHHNASRRGRKRKIKKEVEDQDFVVNEERPKKRGRRGRKPNSKIKREDESIQQMLHRNTRTSDAPAFVGIRNDFGEVKISIPPDPSKSVPYTVFGFACTEKIEDILQPKGRTRYVRGLSEQEKKDRRREQNRNAAARSRARKNAMIAKVIQLHQENLGLRAHISSTIREKEELEQEKERTMAHQSKHTNTCTVYCGYDINKNQNAIKSPRLLQSPYGYVSFRQLTVMKIIDRYSVYVSGLHPRIASIVTLSSDEWFGAFGAICQIRIIQGKAPHEAHLRFQFESSATNAINWVNTHLVSQGLFAKNGYQKYCTKFLQRKICNRQSCSLLHAWKPFTEVLNPEKVRQLNPLKRGQVQYPPEQPNLPKVVMTATAPTATSTAVETINPNKKPMEAPQMEVIQNQITALQQSFDEAKLVVDQLIGEMNHLELENTYLRHENDQLGRRRTQQFAPPAVDTGAPVDTTTEGEYGSLPEMMSTTMEDVDEIVDALCGITWDCSPSSNSLTSSNMESPTWNSSFEQHPFDMDSLEPTTASE